MAITEPDRCIDVRELEEPPFAPIMSALEELGADETLQVTADFEPEPLYDVLDKRGVPYEVERPEPGRWNLLIRPD